MSNKQLAAWRKKKPVIVGFTGTRNGMTIEQEVAVEELLDNFLESGPVIAVHGDCLGADKDFDDCCIAREIARRIRPCTLEGMRAHCEERGAEVVAKPKRPMARNRDIVADAGILIGCPPNFEPIKRGSGTWATIGFGKRKRIPVHIIYPDGSSSGANDG